MGKRSEELFEETYELIQKYERDKAENEKLAKKYADAQRTRHIFGVQPSDKKSTDVTSRVSGSTKSTIGSTTISTEEAEIIKREVRDVVQRVFLGINLSTDHPVSPNMGYGMNELEKPNAEVIDLAGSTAHCAPQAIAGSDVSIASTRSNTRHGENKNSFSQMMSGSGTVTSAQTFAIVQWSPKEPPCYYGRSTEDVHMWTSLVRHYFTFMGGNDAQQAAYAITLLRDSAHEWHTAYEKRNHHMPRDWVQLSTALFERFGSNIRSQEAQSQLMSISQGTRPVREYDM